MASSHRRSPLTVPLITAALLLVSAASGVMAKDRQYDKDTFLWQPELSPNGPVLVAVSLEAQKAAVYRNGIKIGECLVSTGFEGHETPTGVFHILEKDADHRSSTYGNAPMPYSERLTWGGVALHAGALPGYPSSHGCVHLPHEFSKLLFEVTHVGITVVITQDAPEVHVSDGHRVGFQVGERGEFEWKPEVAQEGAVSLLYSSADKRLFVLRNGHTIAEAPVYSGWFSDRPKGTTAFLFAGWEREEDGGVHPLWVQAGGHGDNHAHELDEWFKVDERFLHLVYGMIGKGTNLVLTDQSVTEKTRGAPGFTVLQSSVVEKKSTEGN